MEFQLTMRFLPITMNKYAFEDKIHKTFDFIFIAFKLKKNTEWKWNEESFDANLFSFGC